MKSLNSGTAMLLMLASVPLIGITAQVLGALLQIK